MSCLKPSKGVSEMVIYTVSVLCLLTGIYSLYGAFTEKNAFQKVIGFIWYAAIAGLGLCGTYKRHICMIKGFAVNVILLSIFTLIGTIIVVLGVSTFLELELEESEIEVGKDAAGFLIVVFLIVGLIMAAEVFAGIYAFRLANLIKRENNEKAGYSSPPVYGFQVGTGNTAPPPYAKTTEPLV